ncbi:MAG TPA: hypothetical protein VF469_13850 [Kofleriaceae bacterium]
MNRIWIVIVALTLSAAGCKQGLGERCEVNSDCSSGVCAMASPRICVSDNVQTDQIDASDPCPGCHDPNADAAMDAGPDAMIDAGTDAP